MLRHDLGPRCVKVGGGLCFFPFQVLPSQGAGQEERCESDTWVFHFPERGSLCICRSLVVQMLDEKQTENSLGVSFKVKHTSNL